MRSLLNITPANLCLIAILLWAQVSIAQHGLEHDIAYFGHEVSQDCEVYANADNTKAALNADVIVANVRFDLEALAIGGEYLHSINSSVNGARAPPKITS